MMTTLPEKEEEDTGVHRIPGLVWRGHKPAMFRDNTLGFLRHNPNLCP